MDDARNKIAQPEPDSWGRRVGEILVRVRRRAVKLTLLGICVYVGGTVAIELLVSHEGLRQGLREMLFPICMIYMAVLEMYPCVRGGFEVQLEASRQTVPVFTGIREDLTPVLRDVRSLVDDIKKQDPKRIVEFIEKISKDGTVERVCKSLEAISGKLHESMESGKKAAVDDILSKL